MEKNKREADKKAVLFSLDALIALTIILLTIMVVYPILKYSEKESSVPEDILGSLSELKIGDLNLPYVNAPGTGLIDQGYIKDLNKSVLEQIGEFYVNDLTKPMAKTLAEEVLSSINTNENIGIWIDGKLLASRNTTSYENAKNVAVERQTISGIKEGEEVTGFSARAFLTNSEQTKYYYFGGYVGEGNITLNVNYNGTLSKVELEVAASKQFKICINDNPCINSLAPVVSELIPTYFDLSAQTSQFNPDLVNTFKIIPDDEDINFHIAGGYLKLTYNDGVQYEQTSKHYFPGINGIINLYDGFYVPGDLNSLNVYLKAKVNDPTKKMYIKIGDKEIFKDNTGGSEQEIYVNNAQIESILGSYSDYSEKTIPIRIAVEGVDYEETSVNAHVIPVNGLSGAMNSIKGDINRNGIIESAEKGIEALKYVTNELVDNVIDTADFSYVGLSTTKNADYSTGDSVLPTTRDKTGLHTVINDWSGNGDLDVCPALEKAIEEFKTKPINDAKFMVNLIYKMPNSCNGKTTGEEIKQEIINILCQASKDYKIQIYNVEVGLSGSANGDRVAEAMQYTSSSDTCYGGKYYDGDTYLGGDLVKIYEEIVTEIISLIYNMQIIDVINSADASSYLSPESYIEFDYEKPSPPYGIVINSEKMFSNDEEGSFEVPLDSKILETRVLSYSGSRWTNNIWANNEIVYNLSSYGSDYLSLGDPYAINIPNEKVNIGASTLISLTTGLAPEKTFLGSSSNKIIYTIVKEMVSYSAISEYANGCIWTVEFEDGTFLTVPVPANATDVCYYTLDNHDGPGTVDAMQYAVYNLFKKLDSDGNGKLDVKFEEQNLQISSSEVIGIPYTWETVIQIRKWW